MRTTDATPTAQQTFVAGGDELQVKLTLRQPLDEINDGNRFTFEVSTDAAGGQPLTVDGDFVRSVTFTIVGDWELGDFFEAVDKIREAYRAARDRREPSL
jgi:hypothetical protein